MCTEPGKYLADNAGNCVSDRIATHGVASCDSNDFIMLPAVDFVFKLLFDGEECRERLQSLLCSLLNLKLDEVDHLTSIPVDPVAVLGDSQDSILRTRAILKGGRHINVEIHIRPFPVADKQAMYYLAALYVQQTEAHANSPFVEKCVLINILDCGFQQGKKVRSVYHVSERDGKSRLVDEIELHYLDLAKLRDGDDIEGMDESLIKWLRFLACKEKKELEVVAEGDKELQSAYHYLCELSADERIRKDYESRLSWWVDQEPSADLSMTNRCQTPIRHIVGEQCRAIDRLTGSKAKMAIEDMKIDTFSMVTGFTEREVERILTQRADD